VVAPLYEIVKKGVPFEWELIQQKVQQDLKILIKDCFHTRNPKFLSEQPLVLVVNMLWKAVGYYIYQRDKEDPLCEV